MRLISVFSPSHQELKDDWFLKTLQDRFPLDITACDPEGGGAGDFRSQGWYSVTAGKLRKLASALDGPDGEVVVWCDVDVQFFRPCADIFAEAVRSVDIAFQNERLGRAVNTGVMVIRSNERTRRFFKLAAGKDLRDYWFSDQSLIQELIDAGDADGPSWGFLPDQIFAPSQILMTDPLSSAAALLCPDIMLALRRRRIPGDIALHHANLTWPRWGVGSVRLKLLQLRRVRDWVEQRRGGADGP